jgi:hypothetical protein
MPTTLYIIIWIKICADVGGGYSNYIDPAREGHEGKLKKL